MPQLIQTFSIGDMPVIALSDGAPERALDGLFHNVDQAVWMRAVGVRDPKDVVPFNFGSFLVQNAGHTVLIDSGFGPRAKTMEGAGSGGLLDRLAEAGVRPDAVTDVIHTHLHGDHCGWNVVPGPDGAPQLTFPNATIHVAQQELDYWLDPAMTEERFAFARSQMVPAQAAGHLQTFSGDVDIVPGLTAIATPGHTPGHTSIMMSAQNERLFIVGDAAHHPVHFEHHDWVPGFDLDPAESTRSRAKLSAMAADGGAIVTGGHFPILTLGYIRRVEGGYKWERIERP